MWKTVKLGDICLVTDYVANGSFKSLSDNVKYLTGDGYAILVRLTDFTKGWNGNYKYVDKAAYNFLAKTKLFHGDLLISNVGEPGKTFLVPELGKPMTLAPNSILVRPDSDILNTGYLKYFIDSSFGKACIKGIESGTTQRKFNKTEFRNLEISLPPLAEQQRIVAKLDAAFTEIDAAIATCKQQIFKMECLNQRVVDEAFNNESEHLEFDSIVREKGTGLERRANLQSPNNPFPYLKMNNISAKNRLYISKYTTVDASEEELKKYTLNDGDFLFNTRNSVELVGKTAVVSGLDGWLFNNNILRVKFIEGVNADYINFFFGTSFGKRQLNLRKTGTTNVAAIYYKDLKTIEIPTINEVEQLQIVKKLKAAETEAISFIENINDKIANLLNLKSAILAQELQSEAA